MLQQSGSGNIDWVSLAAKMFMNKLNSQTYTQKQRVAKKTPLPPSPPPLQARPPVFRPRMKAPDTSAPTHLPPDCVATIKQFEALRIQLLRQLVLYQTQLLALKMPPIPSQSAQPTQKTIPSKGKMTQNGSNKVNKQTISKKVKSGKNNDVKKWVQSPVHALKIPNKRRSQVLQKPKKSSMKASKRKTEDVQTAVSNSCYDKNVSKKSKIPCQPYHSCLRNSSSSSDSFYSSKHLKCNNNFGLDSLTGKDMAHKNSSFITCSSFNESFNDPASILRLAKRKASKSNKKISSAFVFDTATDEAQSSL